MKSQLVSIALLLLTFSCGGFAGDDTELLVIIKDYKFIPQHITIKQGQVLVWENR
jgi:hypothetical protein